MNRPGESGSQQPVSLVTGGAGFIGSHIVDALILGGHRVMVLDDLSGGFKANVNEAATFVHGSINDPHVVGSIFSSHQIDYVFHLAAYAAEGLSHFIRCFNYTNNVVGSMVLINAAVRHRCRCFVFTSSIAVYGSGQTPMSEELTPSPEDPYGVGKFAVELDLRAARRMFGLDYIVFRPHNVYGERQNIGDPYRNVIGIFMNNILQGMPCTVFGSGNQRRAFTHISDVAPLIARSINCREAYGETFNVGADTPYTVRDLALAVQKAMNSDTGITYLPAREEVLDAFSDHSKCRMFFGQSTPLTLEQGLARMAAWVRSVGACRGKPFANIEIERDLPPSWKSLCTTNNQ
jgi:UDP-glucose 4-epimerase